MGAVALVLLLGRLPAKAGPINEGVVSLVTWDLERAEQALREP